MTYVNSEGAAVLAATPEDNYDVAAWGMFYEQYPDFLRSVGAAADAGSGDDVSGEGETAVEGDGKGASGEDASDDDGGKGSSHFSESFADAEVKKQAARYGTIEDMAGALRSANVELSKRVKLPGEGADEATIKAFRTTMGVPDDVAGYEISKPKHMEKEVFDSKDTQSSIQAIVGPMHAAGASKAVVDAMLDAYWDFTANANEAEVERVEKVDKDSSDAAEAGLRKLWGAGYDANMGFAKNTSDAYPDAAQLELKNGTLMGNNVHFAKLLSDLGRLKGESQAQLGVVNTEQGVELQAKFDDLTSKMHTAHAQGDGILAKRLEAERRPLSDKLFGTGAVVGSDMRD